MYFILSASAFVCRYEYQNRKIITHCTQPALILALIAFLCPPGRSYFFTANKVTINFLRPPAQKVKF